MTTMRLRPLPTFGFLWALSALMDLAFFVEWTDSVFHMALAVSAVVVLIRPRSIIAFAILNVLRVVVFLHDTPDTANHQFLFGVASLSILALWAWRAIREQRLALSETEILASFAPALRGQLYVLYFFAVFHKLNWDYFNPQVSCAIGVFSKLAGIGELVSAVPDDSVIFDVLIVSSLVAETLIALFLFLPKTRRLGLLIGVLFHCLLGFRYAHFSTGLFAVYTLFAPESAFRTMSDWLESRSGWLANLVRAPVILAISLLVIGSFALVTMARGHGSTPALDNTRLALLAIWAALSLGAFAFWLLARARFDSDLPGKGVGLWLVFVVLVFAHGVSPYVGLRTVPAFSMFSNLRTEQTGNHILLPESLPKLTSMQEDLITIIDSDDPRLKGISERGWQLTFFDLRVRIQKLAYEQGRTGIRLAYRRDGRNHFLTAAETDPQLMAPIPLVQRKWLRFRPVSSDQANGCFW